MSTRTGSLIVAVLLTIGLCAPSYAVEFKRSKAIQTPATKALKGRNLTINKLSATLTASPAAYSGVCPAVITFNGTVRYLGTGKVYYSFVRSDGGTLPFARDRFIRFDTPGTQPVSQTWTLGGPGLPSYTGWEMLKLSTCPPGFACPDAINANSNRAPFSMKCGQATTAPGKPDPKGKPDITSKKGIIIGGGIGGAGGKFVPWGGSVVLTEADALHGSPNYECAFNLSYDMVNVKGVPTGALFENQLKMDAKLVSKQTALSLGAGETKQINTQAYLGTGGHILGLWLDAAGNVAESNEGNNAFRIKYTLKGKCYKPYP